MDSNLLKEAIADAKAVRQIALANAKVALEEAFSERYQAMFAEKLKEDAEQEVTAPAEEEEGMNPAAENVSEQEIDELIKELEAEVGEEPHAEPDTDDMPGAGAPPPPAAPPMGAAGGMPPGAPGCPPPGEAGAGAPPAPGCPCPQCGVTLPAGMTPAPMGGEAGAMPPAPMGGEAGGMPPTGEEPGTPPSDVPPPSDEETDEDVDLNELLESLKEEIEQEEEEEEEEGIVKENTKLSSSGIGGSKAGGSANKKPTSSASSTSKIESAANDDEGMPKVDQAKVTAKEATMAKRPNEASHATKDNLSTPKMGAGNGSGGQSETGMPKTDQSKVTAKEATTAKRPNEGPNANKTNFSTPGGMLEENKGLKKQLNEAEDVIRYVKGQLNEVNLLNGKLLYTNKLFKEYNMNNEQKMRIVEMFDLAKTVREVKLTYANIAESLNFSGNDMKKKVKTNSSVQSITEGLASQTVGSTKPSRQIISEGKASQMVTKFQKLAGIKAPSK